MNISHTIDRVLVNTLLFAVMAALAIPILAGCSAVSVLEKKAAALTLPEAQANLDLALAANDVDGILCFTAARDDLARKAAASGGTSNGYPALWESARLARMGFGNLIPPEVHRACAPIILDAEKTAVSLGLYAAPAAGGLKVMKSAQLLKSEAAALEAAKAAAVIHP